MRLSLINFVATALVASLVPIACGWSIDLDAAKKQAEDSDTCFANCDGTTVETHVETTKEIHIGNRKLNEKEIRGFASVFSADSYADFSGDVTVAVPLPLLISYSLNGFADQCSDYNCTISIFDTPSCDNVLIDTKIWEKPASSVTSHISSFNGMVDATDVGAEAMKGKVLGFDGATVRLCGVFEATCDAGSDDPSTNAANDGMTSEGNVQHLSTIVGSVVISVASFLFF